MTSLIPPGTNRMVPYQGPVNYNRQTIAVPNTKRPGQSAHYRNEHFEYLTLGTPNAFKTLTEVFENGLAISTDQQFLGYRPKISSNPDKFAPHFVWETYAQVNIRRRAVGSALTALLQEREIGGGEYPTVGLWCQNRPEWQIIDLAVQAYGFVSVSLYDTLGKDSVEYIINHSHLTVIFSTSDHVPTLLKLGPKIPTVKLIIVIDNLAPELKSTLSAWGETQNIKIREMRELEAFGKAHSIESVPALPDQIATICYTSGTTNNPKGVILTHGMLAISVQSNLFGLQFPDRALLLSYLPLAHIYGRLIESCVMAVGGSIGYFTGDPLRLLEDAQILRPDVFPSVPRVLNKIFQAAMVAGNVPGLKGAIFKKAVKAKLDKLHATGINSHALWDKLVFRKIQAVLGGRLQMVTTGSAPISPEVLDFLKIALGGEVIEGYGMTENCATCCRGLPYDPNSSGTVGPPQICTEIKLVDVPALGYYAEDKPNPRGELCARGPSCFKQYYKDERNTKETVDAEGWIHTGDVAELDECGRFKIIDRVKNIMKLAQGEYVALEKVENLYAASPVVAQIYVHGESLQSYLIAVVVPDPIQLANIYSVVSGSKVLPNNQAALLQAIQDPGVKQEILNKLSLEAKRNGLRGFETIKRVHLTLEPFSTENGTMTPTMKIRRKDAHKKYKAELDALYSLGEPKL